MNKLDYNYFAIGEEDIAWGLYIPDCGTCYIPPGAAYPDPRHPQQYQFSWENGRILHEYQLIYLLEGSGKFESAASGIRRVEKGDLILLYPEVWHRYKPDASCLWNTFWVGFNGAIANSTVTRLGLSPQTPVQQIGYQEKIIEIFLDILETGRTEFSGYQQVLAGDVMKLLGRIFSIRKNASFHEQDIDHIIRAAKLALMQTGRNHSVESVATDLNIGYSRFRKLFKEYTGVSPGQFQLQHRLKKSIYLLVDTQKTIKEISEELGFESPQYFTRIFKKKTGKNPGGYRRFVWDIKKRRDHSGGLHS